MQAPQSPMPVAARSVHLWYPSGTYSAFYNEVIVEQSTLGSYFMACGFRGGYFGIQDKNIGRRALFSVWDASKGDDKNAVPDEKRVRLIFQGDGVEIGRFGNEGTGGQSFFPYLWELNQTVRFLVTAAVANDRTDYAGYLFLPADGAWKHLVTFSTPASGRALTGLYSFVEDFRRDGRSAGEVRRAKYGNVWLRDLQGNWHKASEARFGASKNPIESQESIDAGLADGRFYLQNGGTTRQTMELNQRIGGATAGDMPSDLPIA